MHSPLFTQIVASPWLISPALAEQYKPLLAGLLEGRLPGMGEARQLVELRAAMQPVDYTLALVAGQASAAVPLAAAGGAAAGQPSADRCNIRVISLSGPLLKDDQECGPYGMATYARFIESAGQNPDIDALVLKMDSPGGQVYGTQSLADAVKNCGKPVVALVSDGLMCSAAYWIGSAASAILATHETCTIGSIGVMASWADNQGKLEKEGVKFHEIYASQSTRKNADFAAARAGDYGPMQERLSAICDQFIGAVTANRGERLDQKAAKKAGAFAGDTFHASQAQELGLIDGIGSLQDAFGLCAQLVQQQRLASPASPNSSATMGLFDKKAAFGPAMQALVGASTVTPEMATAANAELEAMGISGAALITEAAHKELETGSTAWDAAHEALEAAGATDVAALASERDTLKTGMASVTSALTAAGAADVAALAADRDQHKASAEAFGNQPGKLPSTAGKTGNDLPEEGADEAATAIGNLAHNKALEGHPVFG